MAALTQQILNTRSLDALIPCRNIPQSCEVLAQSPGMIHNQKGQIIMTHWLYGHPLDWAPLDDATENTFDSIATGLRAETRADLRSGPTTLTLELNDAFSPLQARRMENMRGMEYPEQWRSELGPEKEYYPEYVKDEEPEESESDPFEEYRNDDPGGWY